MMAVEHRDESLIYSTRGVKTDRIVDIEEWIESKEFLGQKGICRPAIKYHLCELFDSGPHYVEAVFTGGIGVGKGYGAQLGLSYCLYRDSILYSPQLEFWLAPGASIYYIIQSKTKELAKKAVFNEFRELLAASPYFRDVFPFDTKITTELRFPNHIYVTPFGGNDTACLGLNVMGGILDELNFMDRIEDSKHTKWTGEDEYDQAERIYNTISRRMKSRFYQQGFFPGKLFLLSSVNYPGDFTDRKIEEAQEDPTIYVMKLSLWESLPEEKMSKDTFLVEKGNDVKRSRIIKSREEAQDPEDIIEVPVDYKRDFEKDIDGALKDLAGVSVSSRSPFIPYREEIETIMQNFRGLHNGHQLFTREEVNLCESVSWDFNELDDLIDQTYIKDCLDNPDASFAGHIDVGLSGDAAGLAISHIIGYKNVNRARRYDDSSGQFVETGEKQAPIYQIDGLLSITSHGGGEVDLESLMDLVLLLKDYINLTWLSADGFQSVQLLQAARKQGIRSGTLSVDVNIGPYTEIKSAIRDGRILFNHPLIQQELIGLERHEGRVDHRSGGSKDLSDAAAGSIFMLHRREATGGLRRRSRTPKRVTQHLERDSGPVRRTRKTRVPGKTGGTGRRKVRQIRS